MNLIQLNLDRPQSRTDRRMIRQFLQLPFRVYENIPQWVPPLAFEARRMLGLHRNPFFQHSEAAFFFACDWGNPHPDKEIERVELISAGTEATPFLLAVTAWPTKEVQPNVQKN